MTSGDDVDRRRIGRLVERSLNLLGVVIPVVAVILAGILTWQHLTTWRDIAILAVMYVLLSLGVTIGFHRMTAHRSFEATPVVRFVLLALGTSAGMSDPIRWTAMHIQHHARSDRDGDPHSPFEGFFHAHLGWILRGFEADATTYAPRLLDDRMARFFQRTAWYWTVLGFAVPFAVGGWTGLLWGGWVRFFLMTHMAFSVNSICHTFGRVTFPTNDRSRNQWVVGVLGFGEGWHNNHHAFPRSAFHGLRWWQVDVAGYVIAGLERLGLVGNVHRVSTEMMQARRAPAQRPVLTPR